MSITERTCVSAVAALLVWLFVPQASPAQVHIGAQGNYGTETDFGIGGRVAGDLESVNLELMGSFDIYFPDGPTDFWEANANLFYRFDMAENPSMVPYAGGGLNIARISNGRSRTEAGLNVAGGVRFPGEGVTPYIEGRGVISDFDQFVITAGVLFGS